jgi:nitroreductase
MNSIMSCIFNRRSIRSYTSQKVNREDIAQILTAASWAPSGNNLQPWKFSVVMDDENLKKNLSALTIYQKWVQDAPCLISVFLDTNALDNRITNVRLKHVQAIGAAIQNMLLCAYDLGLGTCWIGEILKNEDKVRDLLGVSSDLELMAVISVGYPNQTNLTSKRKNISENSINWL